MSGSSAQALERVEYALRAALEKGDWDSIGTIDQSCRQAIEEAMVDPVDEDALRARMEDLLSLYRQLIARCENEKQRVGVELKKLNQSQQGAKVYQLFG